MFKSLSIISLALLASACSNTIVVEEQKSVVKVATKPYKPTFHFVEFEFDAAEPINVKNMAKQLAPHIAHLTANPSHFVLLQGAGDDSGSFNYNFKLGMSRATFIENYLLERGVLQSQIKVSSVSKANSLLKPYARTVHLSY
ncbi:OmpA family protein [Pseudoalteromonas sp. APC 3358]|uniref:OmpA family protein n=1 Tax=unclassified Pseudoalteromonas TaxID=194690 RepID=UPI00046757EC|nr:MULTISPECIES: OmpA family protein [unclassified Pseudoalteromonas]MDN3384507.1 OmpA family protein [Pseudoalteromonas sp. APC 3358]